VTKNVSLCCLLLAVTPLASAADGYYATKADYRAGRPSELPAPLETLVPGTNAGGDTCASPTVFSTTPFNDSGTTVGANNTVGTLPITCNTVYTQVAGPDVIYQFGLNPTHSGVVISVTPSGGYDTSIYLLTSCGTGTTCPNGAGSDAAGANGVETISATVTNALPTSTYFLFIDSFYATGALSAGAYALSVTGTLPVELLEFSAR
jgi:hypothetical protein